MFSAIKSKNCEPPFCTDPDVWRAAQSILDPSQNHNNAHIVLGKALFEQYGNFLAEEAYALGVEVFLKQAPPNVLCSPEGVMRYLGARFEKKRNDLIDRAIKERE